jgi:curved DNA-binding protein CbpA
LQDDPLPLLLHQLHHDRATGVLKLETRVGRHELYLRDGLPVAVVLPGSAELIGQVLVEMRLIDEATHKRSLATPPPPGKRYGDWLVEQRLIEPEKLKLALKAQVRRKLHRLFFLGEGEFKFEPRAHDEGRHLKESLSVQPTRAIYHGVRSAWTAERLESALFLLDGRAIKCTLEPDAVARYGLGADDGRVAELLRKGYWALPDLVDASGLPAQPVHALVYAFYVTEALDVRGADEVSRLKRRGETSGASPLPTAPARATGRTGSHSVMTPLPGSVPLIRPRADSQPPLTANTPSAGTPAPPVTPSAGTPLIRPRADSRPPITPSRGTSLPPHLTPSRGTAMPPPDLETVRNQILLKSKIVETENLFQVLGLGQDATSEQVKTAYFDAAKRYHPDRLTSMGLESLRGDVEKIFRRVGEAYGTLYDDKRRADYRNTLGKGAEDPAAHARAVKMLEAEMAMRRGEVLLRKGDYVGAMRELEQAVAGNPHEGEHVAYLAWARLCAGQITHAEAKPQFLQATRLSPKCARAWYFLGLCLKEEKENDRAYGMFRKALELDSRLLDAEREMRLINMRKGKEEKKGLFDRFRKPSK